MKNLRNKNHPPNADLVQIYLQSSWDIVTAIYDNLDLLKILADAVDAGELDQYLTATDLDSLVKLNTLVLDATFGDFSSQAEAESGTDHTTTMTPLRVAQAIAILAPVLLNKYDATISPTVNDDSTAGYSVGSVWINVILGLVFHCVDASVGAAVWA